jgi:hypothetical protein
VQQFLSRQNQALFWLKFDVLGKFGGVKNIFAKNLIEF